MSYRLLIVEDEWIVRKSMAESICWAEYDIAPVVEAENGADALQRMEEALPDFIFADIQMPVMDGLTFCERVRKKYPLIKIIIFSGYGQFEYALQALRLGVFDFLVKPVTADDLVSMVKKLCGQLKCERARHRSQFAEEQLCSMNLYHMRYDFLFGKKNRFHTMNTMFLEMADYLKIPTRYVFYTIVAFEIADLDPTEDETSENLLKYSLSKEAEEVFRETFSCAACYGGTSMPVLLLNTEKSPSGPDLLALADRVGQKIMSAFRCRVSAAVQAPFTHLEEISAASFQTGDAGGQNETAEQHMQGKEPGRISPNVNFIVRSTIEYVRSNYQKDISLNKISHDLFVSANYLSTLFKQETGQSFITFLNRYRIMQAQILIAGQPELKIYEIAEKVGYSDYRNFNINFKKVTNCSVKEYKCRQFGRQCSPAASDSITESTSCF